MRATVSTREPSSARTSHPEVVEERDPHLEPRNPALADEMRRSASLKRTFSDASAHLVGQRGVARLEVAITFSTTSGLLVLAELGSRVETVDAHA